MTKPVPTPFSIGPADAPTAMGRTLDAAVAFLVFGRPVEYVLSDTDAPGDYLVHGEAVPAYSTDLNQAMRAWEVMHGRGWSLEMKEYLTGWNMMGKTGDDPWEVKMSSFGHPTNDRLYGIATGRGSTPAIALVRAILGAIVREKSL